MFSLARITLAAPIALTLPANRLRVMPGYGPVPAHGDPRTITGFDACFTVNPVTRTIHAQMPPLPRALLIYGASDFAAACSDTPEQHAVRVLEILGTDPQAYLQAVIDGTELPVIPPRVATQISKLALRRALRTAGLEPALDTFLASNPTARSDWDDSQLLDVRDPLLSESLPAFALASGVTAERIQQLFQSCQVIP